MTKILLSGATGFVASHLIPKLVERGHEVTALHRYVTGRYVLGENYNIVHASLEDADGIAMVVEKVDPEVVIHLGAISAVSYSYDHPREVNDANYMGLINLAESCRKLTSDFQQFISAGTSEEYGNQKQYPIREDAMLHPNSPYAVSKAASTMYLEYMRDAYNFPMTICRPFNCYDETTEVLTDKGWRYFYELDGTELIATLNQENNSLEYQKPYDYTYEAYQGDMIKVSGSQIDLLVTPNHRMYVRSRSKEQYEIVHAEKLLEHQGSRRWVFQHNVDEWKPTKKVDPKWYNPTWLKFMAWWLSEGTIDRRPNRNAVDIRQTKQNNLEEIYNVVVELGYKPHRNHTKNERVGFSDKTLHAYLEQFGYSKEKYIPQEIKELPRELIRVFLETYQKGDGSRGSHNGYEVRDCLLSSSPKMIDDLHELVLKAGWSATANGRYLTIARTRTETCPRTRENFAVQKYNGRIYCVSVPNEIIYVRRNGKAVWCGNTYGRVKNRHFVTERILTQMLEGVKELRLGDPDPVRDLLFRDDHVDAYLMVLNNADAVGEKINFCTGVGYSIAELVSHCAETTGWSGDIVWNTIPKRPLDIDVLIGDCTKARGLGWTAKYDLKQGLIETYKGLIGHH